MKPGFIPEGFELVYQGGHHGVYCNGARHQTTRGGGFTKCFEPKPGPEAKCDCWRWKPDGGGVQSWNMTEEEWTAKTK